MPDNFDNWTPDDQFWADAWSDMKTRLDKDEKARPTYWRLLALILLLAGGLAAWYWSGQTPSAEQLDTKVKQVASTEIDASEDEISEPISPAERHELAIITEEKINLEESSVAVSSNQIAIDAASTASASSSPVFNTSQPASASDQPASEYLNSPSKIDADEQVLAIDLEQRYLPAEVLNSTISLIENQAVVPDIDLHTIDVDQFGGTFKKSKTTAYELSILASHGTSVPGLGYGMALGARFPLEGKWSLGVATVLRQEQVGFRLGTDRSAGEDVLNQSPPSTITIPQLDQTLEDQQLNYGRFLSLGIETRLYRQLSDKWRLSVGVQGHYVLNAVGPAIESGQATAGSAFLERSADTNIDLTSNLNNFLAFSNAGTENMEMVDLSRWQLDVLGGVDFLIGSRWQLGADMRYRATDYLDSDAFRFSRWRGQLRLGYTF